MKIFSFVRQISRQSLKVGDSVKETRIITQRDLDRFSDVTSDHNPIHKPAEHHKPLVHGAFLNGIVAGLIGTRMPGPGTIVISQNFSFPTKCVTDVPIDILVELIDVRKIVKVRYECKQFDKVVFEGQAKLLMSKVGDE